MDPPMTTKIDMTQPHIGRIYDFILGGDFHYPCDRQAAAAILQVFPAYPKWARANRNFLSSVAAGWAKEGRHRVLDLGSGLPAQQHFNHSMPDARILFSDNDPWTVECGQQILNHEPDMHYCQADLRDPDAVIDQATRFFGEDRKLAVGCIGVSYFLPDASLGDLMKRLHGWCAPGSVMAISFLSPAGGPIGAEFNDANATMARLMNVQSHLRTTEQLAEIIRPWRLQEVRPIDRWAGSSSVLTDEEQVIMGLRMMGGLIQH